MSAEPLPDWLYPEGGLTAADLDHLPGLPERTELIDGGLHFMSPQKRTHMEAALLLWSGLRSAAPDDLAVVHEMSIVLGRRDRVQPDVSVVQRQPKDTGDETWYSAAVTELVVEVVSPESQERDCDRKPQLFARAGINHFWRVEESAGQPVVHVHELDPASGTYLLTGMHHDRLTLSVPFPLEIVLRTTS